MATLGNIWTWSCPLCCFALTYLTEESAESARDGHLLVFHPEVTRDSPLRTLVCNGVP